MQWNGNMIACHGIRKQSTKGDFPRLEIWKHSTKGNFPRLEIWKQSTKGDFPRLEIRKQSMKAIFFDWKLGSKVRMANFPEAKYER